MLFLFNIPDILHVYNFHSRVCAVLSLAICLLVKSVAEFMFILQTIYFILYLRYCFKNYKNQILYIGQNIRNRPDTQPLPELTNMLQCFRNLKLKLLSEEFVYDFTCCFCTQSLWTNQNTLQFTLKENTPIKCVIKYYTVRQRAVFGKKTYLF